MNLARISLPVPLAPCRSTGIFAFADFSTLFWKVFLVEDRPKITSSGNTSTIGRDSNAANFPIILSSSLYAAIRAIRTRARGHLVAGQTRPRFGIGFDLRRKPKARALGGKAALLFTWRTVFNSKHSRLSPHPHCRH